MQKSYKADLIHYGLSAFNHLLSLKAWNFEEDRHCKLRQFVIFCIQKKPCWNTQEKVLLWLIK